MQENPYRAPGAAEQGTRSNPKNRRQVTTTLGCLLAVIVGYAIGFGLLYLARVVRELMP